MIHTESIVWTAQSLSPEEEADKARAFGHFALAE